MTSTAVLTDQPISKLYSTGVPRVDGALGSTELVGTGVHATARGRELTHPGAQSRHGYAQPRVRRVQIGVSAPKVRVVEDDDPWPGDRLPDLPLPDPTALCGPVVRAAAEVLVGIRTPGQLAGWVTPQLLDQLLVRARILRLAAERGEIPPPDRSPVQIRRVRLDRIAAEVAEAAVILESAGRLRAAAARLEVRRGQWRLAVLDLA